MSKKVKAGDVDAFLAESQEWEHDRIQATKASEKKAWRVAFISLGLAVVCALANLFLFPLKTVEHHVARVDMTTGIVDIQRCLDCQTSYNEVTDYYWLSLYVRTREGFTFPEFDSIYRTIGLLSSQPLTTDFYEYFRPENPASPVATYGDRIKVKIKIRSISWLDKNVATVRFLKIQSQPGARPTESYWIATVRYRYVNAPSSLAEREINPLGFQVTDYRIDPESNVEVVR